MLLFSGLVDIPDDILESARLDGAAGFSLLRHIVLPMSLPVLFASFIFSINGTLKVFDSVFALTDGGPGNATTPLTLYMYRTAFQFSDYGYGCTIALLLTVLCLLVTLLIFRSSRRDNTSERATDHDRHPRHRRRPLAAGVPTAQPRTRHRVLKRVPAWLTIAFLILVTAYPLFWMFINSLKTHARLPEQPVVRAAPRPGLGQLRHAWETGNLATTITNRSSSTVPSLVFIVLLGTAAGFALEVLVFRGRGTILLLFLAGIMIPGQMIILPLFTAFFDLGITGSLLADDPHLHGRRTAADGVHDGDLLPRDPARDLRGRHPGRRVA